MQDVPEICISIVASLQNRNQENLHTGYNFATNKCVSEPMQPDPGCNERRPSLKQHHRRTCLFCSLIHGDARSAPLEISLTHTSAKTISIHIKMHLQFIRYNTHPRPHLIHAATHVIAPPSTRLQQPSRCACFPSIFAAGCFSIAAWQHVLPNSCERQLSLWPLAFAWHVV